MDLEVEGRHALLFDDDAMAAFVNSGDALVEWNSLSIDRYDVRHLLSGPPPPRKRRRHHNQGRSSSSPPPPDHSLEPELDQERYLDLPLQSDEQDAEVNGDFKPGNSGAYHSIGFSYGKPDDSTDQKDADAGMGCAGFRPPFPVPESLLQNLPPSEKVHQIIARTAIFVSKHGGQSEIVLRVKHGDNPTFGFLMPDHHLYAYYRFLVDNKEFLKSDVDGKSQEDDNSQAGGTEGGGALSLLGSVYGSGEDEDGVIEAAPESVKSRAMEPSDDAIQQSPIHDGLGQTDFSSGASKKDETNSKQHPSSKEKSPLPKRIGSIHTAKVGKKGDVLGPSSAVVNKSGAFPVLNTPKVEKLILEPPADMKRVIDKIVEFIFKNGRDFEAVLIEQDSKYGRVPFLLPSDKYHPYYLEVLQKAQESKVIGKKDDPVGHGAEKKYDTSSLGSVDHDMPYDSDRKEKFKMVLGKSKKDGQDQPSKSTQQQFGVSVDAAAAAAILQAATRGIRYPNLDFFPKTSVDGSNHGLSSEGGQASSLGALASSQLQGKPDKNGDPGVSVPAARAIAKTAALAAADEADSSEASLSREQKLKAERLKRAKMFAAMIKCGAAAPVKNELPRGMSVEPPPESRVSESGGQLTNILSKEREGSSVPPDVDVPGKKEENEIEYADNAYNKQRSKRKYRSRTNRHEEEEEEEEDAEKEEEGEEEERVVKEEERSHKQHSRKKHRSRHSSHHSKDRRKHHKRHSKDESRYRHKGNESSYDDDDHHHHHHRRRSSKHRKRPRSEREIELEEGEISTKYSDQSKASVGDGTSREASPNASLLPGDRRATSQPPKVAEVSDDLRAKVRAMLLANL